MQLPDIRLMQQSDIRLMQLPYLNQDTRYKSKNQ